MYYEEKDRLDSYFSHKGNRNHNGIHFHHSVSHISPTNLSSRKLLMIKSLVQNGLYETEEKIRITATRLLKFTLK